MDGIGSPEGMMDISRFSTPGLHYPKLAYESFNANGGVPANSSCSRTTDAYSPSSHLSAPGSSPASAAAHHAALYSQFHNLSGIVKSEFWPHSYVTGHHGYAAPNYNMSPIQS